jgi:hypothetical protein
VDFIAPEYVHVESQQGINGVLEKLKKSVAVDAQSINSALISVRVYV